MNDCEPGVKQVDAYSRDDRRSKYARGFGTEGHSHTERWVHHLANSRVRALT